MHKETHMEEMFFLGGLNQDWLLDVFTSYQSLCTCRSYNTYYIHNISTQWFRFDFIPIWASHLYFCVELERHHDAVTFQSMSQSKYLYFPVSKNVAFLLELNKKMRKQRNIILFRSLDSHVGGIIRIRNWIVFPSLSHLTFEVRHMRAQLTTI